MSHSIADLWAEHIDPARSTPIYVTAETYIPLAVEWDVRLKAAYAFYEATAVTTQPLSLIDLVKYGAGAAILRRWGLPVLWSDHRRLARLARFCHDTRESARTLSFNWRIV